MRWYWWIVVVLMLGIVFKAMGPPDPPPDPRDLPRSVCKDFVQRSLNNPDSAEFTDRQYWPASETKANLWSVRLSVHATNSFNALVLADFLCVVEHQNGQWVALSVTQITP